MMRLRLIIVDSVDHDVDHDVDFDVGHHDVVHQVVEFRPSEPSVDLKPSVRIEQQAHGR